MLHFECYTFKCNAFECNIFECNTFECNAFKRKAFECNTFECKTSQTPLTRHRRLANTELSGTGDPTDLSHHPFRSHHSFCVNFRTRLETRSMRPISSDIEPSSLSRSEPHTRAKDTVVRLITCTRPFNWPLRICIYRPSEVNPPSRIT